LKARAAAFFADKLDIGKKLHLAVTVPSPLAVSAAGRQDVEGKCPAE